MITNIEKVILYDHKQILKKMIFYNEELEEIKKLAKMKMKYVVLKNEDIEKYVPKFMVNTLEDICKHIEDGRREDGKKPENIYIVINTDEPYAPEVIEILKRHGHWG